MYLFIHISYEYAFFNRKEMYFVMKKAVNIYQPCQQLPFLTKDLVSNSKNQIL